MRGASILTKKVKSNFTLNCYGYIINLHCNQVVKRKNMARDEKLEDVLIDFGNREGERILNDIFNEYPVIDDNDIRRDVIIFYLFTSAIQILHSVGWNEKELVREVFDHCEIARDTFMKDNEE
jgi:hypothetical protein